MGRKLRSMFKPVTARPGTGERPSVPVPAVPLAGTAPAGSVVESVRPGGGGKADDASNDAVAKLAYERWLETGGGEVENWLWAEAELKRRGG